MDSDVETIKGLISAWTQAVNSNDTDRILGFVAADLEMIPPGEPPVTGPQAHALLRSFFQDTPGAYQFHS